LQKSLNRKTWEVTKLKAEKERQDLILVRKKEEVQLNKQKLVELQHKMQRGDEVRRPRSSTAVSASFVNSLRNSNRPYRTGSNQRKQHKMRQQKLRQLGKRLVSTATRRRGLQETVRKERAARDAAVRSLEELYEQKEDESKIPDLDTNITMFELEIDAKNQTIAAMHDAMNDEDLSDTTSLLATLPIDDYADLITILVDLAAKNAAAGDPLDAAGIESLLNNGTPIKARGGRKKGRPSSEPRRRSGARDSSSDSKFPEPKTGGRHAAAAASLEQIDIDGTIGAEIPKGAMQFDDMAASAAMPPRSKSRSPPVRPASGASTSLYSFGWVVLTGFLRAL
jgi:hypothetical protein